MILSVGVSHAMSTPTFSLKNNSTYPIKIDLRQQGESLFFDGIQTIQPNRTLKWPVDTTYKTIIHLFFCSPSANCQDSQTKLNATFPDKKTIYIKFDGTTIEAQKGSKNMTTDGYSTAHNITNNDFTVIKSTVTNKVISAQTPRPSHTQSAPPRPTKPLPAVTPHPKPSKPAKPSADTKPYYNLAWAKFPAANAIKNHDTTSLQKYYAQSNDPQVLHMAQAVLGISPTANEDAINAAYKNTINKFSTSEFSNNQMLLDEILKIIDTAYAIVTK